MNGSFLFDAGVLVVGFVLGVFVGIHQDGTSAAKPAPKPAPEVVSPQELHLHLNVLPPEVPETIRIEIPQTVLPQQSPTMAPPEPKQKPAKPQRPPVQPPCGPCGGLTFPELVH